MKKIILALLMITVLPLAGCDSMYKPQDEVVEASPSTAIDEQVVKETIRKEVASVNAGDQEGLFSILSKDVEFIIPGMAPVKGDEARKWFGDFMTQNHVRIQPYTNEEIDIAGDLAYHRYSFEWSMSPKTGGDTITERGSGLHIFKRQSDSTWLLVKDIWIPFSPTARK